VAKARRPTYGVLGSFGIGIGCVTACTVWLLAPNENAAYFCAVVLFFVQLASLVGATIWAVKQSLWT